MNNEHRELCSSPGWATHLRDELLPWAFAKGQLPSTSLLEVGPGPGAATDVLRDKVNSVTALEFDAELAAGAGERFRLNSNVAIVRGDAAALPFRAHSFDGVAAFTMLHHLPDADAQDRAFSEFARVCRAGGTLLGTDSLDSPGLRRLHEGDRLVPLDPLTLGARLEAAGFTEVTIAVLAFGLRFTGRKPV